MSKMVPTWYYNALINIADDTLIINWEQDKGGKFHRGYCKFCNELLYDASSGEPENEYSHMIKNHPEQIAIYRLGNM